MRPERCTSGPESAGAVPGPVCYALGGTQPTLTDANLLLGLSESVGAAGRSAATRPCAGGARLSRSTSRGPLRLDLLEAAYGVHQIAVANMVRAVKAISSERGRDPRRFAFVAYGGNGPLHAVSAAMELGVRSIVVPPAPGVFSAFGLLAADPAQHAARSFLCLTQRADAAALEQRLRRAGAAVPTRLLAQGHAPANSATWRARSTCTTPGSRSSCRCRWLHRSTADHAG